MRELSQMELDSVEGGNPAVVVVPIVVGVVVLAGIALLGYAVYNECDASMEISDEGLSIEVSCSGEAGG